MSEQLKNIVTKIQEETGYLFSEKEIADVVAYSERKCQLNKKGEEYVPIMFESELMNYFASTVYSVKNFLKNHSVLMEA